MPTNFPNDTTAITAIADDDLFLVSDTSDSGAAKEASLDSIRGSFYKVTAAETAAGVTPTNKKYPSLNVKRYGALGDGATDDTAAINAAISVAEQRLDGSVVFFPAGVYMVSSTLLTDSSGVELVGETEKGAISYSPLTFAGSQIQYTANDGGPIVQFGANSAVRFANKIRSLRVGAASSVTTPPEGVRLNVCSEFSLDDFAVNGGCSSSVVLNGCFIGRINNFYIAESGSGMRFEVDTAVSGITKNESIWMQNGNIWDTDDDAIQVAGNTVNCVLRDSWIEYATNALHFVQESDVQLESTFSINNTVVANGSGAPTDSRLIRATAFAGGSTGLLVNFDLIRVQTYNISATHNITYTKGTNTSVDSYIDRANAADCIFYGASTAVVSSDTASSIVVFTGRTRAKTGFASGSDIPLTASPMRLYKMTTELGYLSMADSAPLALPGLAPLSFTPAGQTIYSSTRNRIAYTANGELNYVLRPKVATYGDESVSVTVAADAETLVFNTPLTANRTVTLSTTNAYSGARFRVTRTAAATGGSTLSAGGLKTLAAGEWCDVEYNGSAWVLTAHGSL